MRIDLFLKVTGLLKTRSLAAKAITAGTVFQGGESVKSSTAVISGSILTMIKPTGQKLTVKILAVPLSKNVSKKDRLSFYEVICVEEPDC